MELKEKIENIVRKNFPSNGYRLSPEEREEILTKTVTEILNVEEELSFIECWACKESLQIGQEDWLYTNETSVRQNLNLFLQRHQGHSLVFNKKRDYYPSDWKNFESLPYEVKLQKSS